MTIQKVAQTPVLNQTPPPSNENTPKPAAPSSKPAEKTKSSLTQDDRIMIGTKAGASAGFKTALVLGILAGMSEAGGGSRGIEGAAFLLVAAGGAFAGSTVGGMTAGTIGGGPITGTVAGAAVIGGVTYALTKNPALAKVAAVIGGVSGGIGGYSATKTFSELPK